jgi:fluoroacetyl-CoA thioesterase
MPLVVGLNASVRAVVSEADTAAVLGSGDVPVLGTPRLLALAEAATVAAVERELNPGETTVGTSVTLEHRRASPVGSGLVVQAELTEVDGRRLVFSFIARQEERPGAPGEDQPVLGAGTIERIVISTDRFLAHLIKPPPSP